MFAPEKDVVAAHRRRIKGGPARQGSGLHYHPQQGEVQSRGRAARYTRSPAMAALKDSVPRMLQITTVLAPLSVASGSAPPAAPRASARWRRPDRAARRAAAGPARIR